MSLSDLLSFKLWKISSHINTYLDSGQQALPSWETKNIVKTYMYRYLDSEMFNMSFLIRHLFFRTNLHCICEDRRAAKVRNWCWCILHSDWSVGYHRCKVIGWFRQQDIVQERSGGPVHLDLYGPRKDHQGQYRSWPCWQRSRLVLWFCHHQSSRGGWDCIPLSQVSSLCWNCESHLYVYN